MMVKRLSIRLILAAVVAVAALQGRSVWAIGVNWSNTGTGGWEANANWTGNGGFVPAWEFNEAAAITNGGTAVVTTDQTSVTTGSPVNTAVAGVRLGDFGIGTLQISPGGKLTSAGNSSGETGAVSVGAFGTGGPGTGTLIMNGTQANPAVLTASALSVGGNVGSSASFSGYSTATITNNITGATLQGSGAMNFDRFLTITGPNIAITGTGAVTVNNYTAVITGATHSTIKSSGNLTVNTGGGGSNLNLQFSGFNPTVGTTYTLFDVGSTANTRWDNVPAGGFVPFTGTTIPIGSGFRLKTTPGGTNGQQLQVALEANLVLRVNRDTGEMLLRNPQAAAVTQLTGYEITSPRGSLLAAYKGISGAPAGDSGWEKAGTNGTTGLAEFKPSGTFNVSSAATNVTLGTGFSKLAYPQGAGAGVANLGSTGEDLTFRYTSFGGTTLIGQVEYVGTPFVNNLSIVGFPDGHAVLKNDSLIALSVDGYSIASSTGALAGAGWNSLTDRTDTRFDGWQKSPVTATAMSETNPDAAPVLVIQPGESFPLGDIGDFSTAASQAGVSMTFILDGAATERTGTVRFTKAGDFDLNGTVDGNDFLVWQRDLSVGSLADWKANFGQTGAVAAASAVPEPSVAVLGLVAIALAAPWRRANRFSVSK